ncbi:MAG: AmmeMemoRadiSam system protein A [Patescibacteria group bacterium]|jgi:AmmeMemoRadiSam system protein A
MIALLSKKQQKDLLDIARSAVEERIGGVGFKEYNNTDRRLAEPEGAFVTLRRGGELRGCIGMIEAAKPLWQTVKEMAVEAATHDWRFMPLEAEELPELEYEVSVLSRPEKITDWRKIELGRQGVIVKRDGRSGVFLPQVAKETGWTREEFLQHLCVDKAGLEPDAYDDPATELYVFEAQVFGY